MNQRKKINEIKIWKIEIKERSNRKRNKDRRIWKNNSKEKRNEKV